MFVVVGLIATAILFGVMSAGPVWRRLLLIVMAVGAIALLVRMDVGTRGTTAWWQQPLWRNLILYAVMFAGMMFRVVSDRLEVWKEQKDKPGARRRRPRFNFWEFVYPVMPSLALFQAVLWSAGDKELSLQVCLASFQNGFFWQTLLAKTKEVVGAKA